MIKKQKVYRRQILSLLQSNLELIFKNRNKNFIFLHNEYHQSYFELQVCKNGLKCKFIFKDFQHEFSLLKIAQFVGVSFQIGTRTTPSNWKLFLIPHSDDVSKFIRNDNLIKLLEYFLLEYDGSASKKKNFLTMREKVKLELFSK